ncbi:MAG: starvation-inducible DNA-binding protein [Paraglaciecola sp.]|jgi:starvation-inducible DNA-binding protein
MFVEHYTELAIAADDIAERIRFLVFAAPGTCNLCTCNLSTCNLCTCNLCTCKEFSKLSPIEEVRGVPTAKDMIVILIKSDVRVIRTALDVLKAAQNSTNESTVSLVFGRMRVHETRVWT